MKIISENFLGGAMYAPFCRTLPADMSEWENDFKNMKALGLKCVHGFSEWHDVEREKGRFDFTAIDYMISLAAKYDIVAIVNICTANSVGFYSPRWLMKECAGAEFVDSKGNATRDCLYTVPCLDDPTYIQYANRYLTAVAKHFAGDTRVGGYVIWGEPQLFRVGESTPICFCKHTMARFRKWLSEKYASIDELNRIWSSEGPTDFASFDEVLPPKGAGKQIGGYASWSDFRHFMTDNFASHIKNVDNILKANGATQPTIIEMNYNFGCEWTGNHWKILKCSDIVGVSSFQRPGRGVDYVMCAATSVARAQGKSTFVVECLGGNKIFYKNPETPSADEIRSNMIQRAFNGAMGAMYWCYRPRVSDCEGGEWGMVLPSGRPTYRAKAGGKISNELYNLGNYFCGMEKRADIAVYTSSEIDYLADADGLNEPHRNELLGAQYMLRDLHMNCDFINEEFIENIKNYKVLILPLAYILSENTIKVIKEFVGAGGVVIGDYIVGMKKPNGYCYKDMRDSGLEAVFGIEDYDALVIKGADEKIEEIGANLGARIADPFITTATTLVGYNGGTALSKNAYGDGFGYYYATLPFNEYFKTHSVKIREHIKSILAECGVYPDASLEKQDALSDVTTFVFNIEGNGRRAFAVMNDSQEAAEDTLVLPLGNYFDLDGTPRVGEVAGEKIKFKVTLSPMATEVFMEK